MEDGRGEQAGSGPLDGVTVLELGSFIAGPFAGQILGDYGATVIKVEPPGQGDPMRQWGVLKDGESLWWPSIARNKRSVCIDLRQQKGIDLVRRLAESADIVLENFRPGRLTEWGLDYETLAARNPALVMIHVSGFGQTGPRASEAGFGSIGEAVGGLRYTTGNPDKPPSRAGISLGDALAALFAVSGGLAALSNARLTGVGQEVDVAIYEAVAALMESTMADFELAGVRRERTGSVLPGVAPSNVYPTLDDSEVLIAANADAVFARLCVAMGREELMDDRRYSTHAARGAHMAELDDVVSEWTRSLESDDLLKILETHGVPAGRIFTAPDMLHDPHYAARDMVLRLESRLGFKVPMQGIVPKFSRTPGSVRATGPALGADTYRVLTDFAGLDSTEYRSLLDEGVVYASADERVA
jgi:formyl-CoA transferase